jgi:hypothetical protein
MDASSVVQGLQYICWVTSGQSRALTSLDCNAKVALEWVPASRISRRVGQNEGGSKMMHATHLVIGGGSSGCVMAARLCEAPANYVVLLEAGRDHAPDQTPESVRDTYRAAL